MDKTQQDQAKSEPVKPTEDNAFMDTGVLHEPAKPAKSARSTKGSHVVRPDAEE